MSYLLDKKIKRKKFIYLLTSIVICIILFYFRLGIWNGFSFLSHTIFRPVIILGDSIGEQIQNASSYFISKSSLYSENESLKSQLNENKMMMVNYNSLLVENLNLKEILGRKNIKMNVVLSAILSKPNQSLYDTLVIDAGEKQGIKVGDMVFALGNVPIGRVSDVYSSSSKVILFSNSGEKTQVVVENKSVSAGVNTGKNIFMEIVGRGGGNFEMILPRDFTVLKGDEVTLPGIMSYVVGTVETIISDPRDPFIKALLVSPVNIQELKFVEVEN
ncbi:MAG: rod shape-determining protein MreC [bacterium]